MNVDFHFHTCPSKINRFQLDYFMEMAAQAHARNLAAICITDHFDGLDFERIYAVLDERIAYNGLYYLAEGVRFYAGMEVELREGPHLLVSGDRDSVLTFYKRLKSQGVYASLSDYLALQEGLELLNIFAHPFRLNREIERVDAALLARFDAFDLNGKDVWRNGPEYRARVEQLGLENHLPIVAGSDTHHFESLGSIYNQFHRPFETVADLRRLIQDGQYSIVIHPQLNQMIETAQAIKRELKRAAKRDMQTGSTQ